MLAVQLLRQIYGDIFFNFKIWLQGIFWANFWVIFYPIELPPRSPWRRGARANYILDMLELTFGGLKKDSLEFTTANKKND